MKHFKNITNLEELRKEYRRLLKENHPDNGGSTEAAAEINAEYDVIFSLLKAKAQQTADTDEQKADTETKYNEEYDYLFRQALNSIINLNLNIEIIGCWIWVSGNTYAVKTTLKESGYTWINSRKAWTFHSEPYKKHSKKQKSMDELRNVYGSQVVKIQQVGNMIAG